jgi:Na+/proline symporter
VPVWLLMIVLGAISTAYTFLGGMKAVIWTDVIQSLVMVAGLVLMIGSVWLSLDGGPQRVWQVNEELGRGSIADLSFSWSNEWSLWAALPHFALAMLSFYVADQITAQRYLTAKSLTAARRSFVLNSISVSIMVPALCYVGMALLAYYHDHPQDIRAKWVVNVDNSGTPSSNKGAAMTGPRSTKSESETAPPSDGKPLIGWYDEVSTQTAPKLIAEKRLLDPNTGEAIESLDEVLDPATGQLDVERVGRRLPPPISGKLQRGEMVLNKSAQGELMPHYITRQLSLGVAGLILAALLAASMSSMDSGLNSICTLLVMDFHRRLGWGRAWLASRLDKPADQLDEADELRLGRPLVVLIGVAATLCSLLMGQIESIWDIMINVINTVGGPLLGIFLLGILTRRATARSALVGLGVGILVTVYLVVSSLHVGLDWLWPFATALDSKWNVIIGVLVTFAVGYFGGYLLGPVKTKEQLRGLVAGIGELGQRTPAARPSLKIEIDDPANDNRWK